MRPSTAVPLVAGCLGWLECRVVREPRSQDSYDLVITEVVQAWADPEVFSDGHGHFPDASQRTIHDLAGGNFFSTGEASEV